MGCLAFVHKLKASPYASLLEESLNSEKLEVNFTKEYSVWMELPLQSAIEQW